MVATSEFRIGNLVNNIYGYVKIIDAIHSNGNVEFDDTSQQYGYIYVKPIPLTEEWLLKCGFEKVGNSFYFWENSIYSIEKNEKNWQVYYASSDRMLVIKFLHQIQNLFWCLTGKELTINI